LACAHSELNNSEIWVLRRIFGPKRDEVTGGWRNLHNEELHNLSFLPSTIRMIKSRRIRWAGHVARIGAGNTYRILVGNPEGKRRRLMDNINIDLRDSMGWYALDRHQWRGSCEQSNEPSGSIKCWEVVE
jgi:hypothetical protein